MKRVLVIALVAVAGVFAAGTQVKADHFRYVGHHHHGGYGGYGGGYNRGYSNYGYRPSVSIGIGYGAPVYRQSYYGGGYGYPSYGYGGYYAPVSSYYGGYGGYGGGCR